MKKIINISRLVKIFYLIISTIAMLAVYPASAQTTTRYTNSVDSAAGGITNVNACSIAAALQRNFVVTDNFTVGDVNLGVLLSHGDRDDVALFLRSPAGNIINAKALTGGAANNYNVLLDDQAPTGIAAHLANDIATATTAVPPYQRTFAPTNSLNAGFAGQNSAGTWTLFICDFDNNGVAGGDGSTGTFFQADLFLSTPAPFADLSLSKTINNINPPSKGTAIYTLTVNNAAASSLAATGVQVQDIFPTGVSFNSASGTGSFNPATGIWNVGTVAIGTSVSINITVNIDVGPGGTITNSAQIISSSAPDVDSTPNNGSTTEDDDDTATFTASGSRVAGVAPTLVCTAGTSVFDWDGRSWVPGSINNNFTQAGIGNVNVALTPTTVYQPRGPTGTTPSPYLDNGAFTGGLTPAQNALTYAVDFANRQETHEAVFTFETPISGAQFLLFDIDFTSNLFADRITVVGELNGVTVLPVITAGVTNFANGNIVTGDIPNPNNNADGNATVTFTQTIDTIRVIYGSDPVLSPVNPTGQTMSIHDITYCNPNADISVTKISQIVSDPINGSTDPKAIPGSNIRYCILITNDGEINATNIVASDVLLADISYVANSLQSGSNCSGTLTAEDDDANDAAETDPFRISYDPAASARGTVTGIASTLAPAESFAIVFQATVD